MKDVKKILFVLNYFVSKNVMGGTDRLIIGLVHSLKTFGYEVDVFFPNMKNSDLYYYNENGVNAKLLDGKLFSQAVLDMLEKEKYSLLVTHFFTPYSKYLKLYSNYVEHIISMEHMSRPIDGKHIKRRIKDKIQYFFYSKYVDKIIHCCNYLKEEDCIDYSSKIAKKSLTIYNGIECESSVKFDKFKDMLKIVCIGRLVKEKGFHHAIKAVNSLNNENIQLDIYGDGNYVTQLKNMSCENKRIQFHGFVPNIIDVLKEADILLLPSYQEAFPFVILEACSIGTVVIATDVGGIPEIIINNENGFLIEAQSTQAVISILKKIILQKEDIQRIKESAYYNVKDNFSFSSMIDSHIKVIKGMLNL